MRQIFAHQQSVRHLFGQAPEKFTIKARNMSIFHWKFGIEYGWLYRADQATHKPYYETFSPKCLTTENQPMWFPLTNWSGYWLCIEQGYTVCWDGDVKGTGFLHNESPIRVRREDYSTDRARFEAMPNISVWMKCSSSSILSEINVTSEIRQTVMRSL